jgi:hypothetical protein
VLVLIWNSSPRLVGTLGTDSDAGHGHVDCWWVVDLRHNHQFQPVFQGGTGLLAPGRCFDRVEYCIRMAQGSCLSLAKCTPAAVRELCGNECCSDRKEPLGLHMTTSPISLSSSTSLSLRGSGAASRSWTRFGRLPRGISAHHCLQLDKRASSEQWCCPMQQDVSCSPNAQNDSLWCDFQVRSASYDSTCNLIDDSDTTIIVDTTQTMNIGVMLPVAVHQQLRDSGVIMSVRLSDQNPASNLVTPTHLLCLAPTSSFHNLYPA